MLSSDGVSVRCGSAWALRNTLAFVREDDPARRLFSMWAVNGTSAVEGVIELNDFYLGASADKPFSLAMKTYSPSGARPTRALSPPRKEPAEASPRQAL